MNNTNPIVLVSSGGLDDPTEAIRRDMVAEINAKKAERKLLEDQYGQIWDTTEVRNDFEVLGFMAPFVVVRRKVDGVKGSLMFQHMPRYYFSFTAD